MQLEKVCAACGKERKTRALRYDPSTFKAYCENPYICGSNEHPNSPRSLIERGTELDLKTSDEIKPLFEKYIQEQYAEDKDQYDRIRKLLTMPFTVRFSDPRMARFIVALEDEKNTTTSEAIRICVAFAMERMGVEVAEPTPAPAPASTPAPVAEPEPQKADNSFGTF